MTTSKQHIPELLSAALVTDLDMQLDDGEALVTIEQTLHESIAHARATWRGVPLEQRDFIAHLTPIIKAQLTEPSPPPGAVLDVLTTLHIVDLYLACAALAHSPEAITTFQTRYAPEIASIAARFDSHRLTRDDLVQSLHTLLLVGNPPATPPKLERYTGSGALYSWIRVTASRHFIDLTRSRIYSPPDTPLADELLAVVVDHGDDIETRFLKDTYRDQFKRAVGKAVDSLDAEQRILLRQSFIERQSIDALSFVHGVHRATVARRIQRARDDLFAHARRHMMQELKLDQAEFTSIFNLIQSRLDVSIQRLLTQPTP